MPDTHITIPRARLVELEHAEQEMQALQVLLTKAEAERAALAAAPAPAPLTVKLGSYGCAFDQPSDRRAYTYQHQPTNVKAWKIGEAHSRVEAGGDRIDRGLSLLNELQEKGFGVFELADALPAERAHGIGTEARAQAQKGE